MVVVSHATGIAVRKARDRGIAIVGVNHINTSSGALGYYARLIAQAGLVGFVFAEASEMVAPEGSHERVLGTNPLAIGMPSDGGPLVLDLATSAMAYYGVIEARTAGRRLPDGAAFDKDRKPTTDPGDVIDGGALRTFDGGPKSSGLSLMVQALAGPLVGAAFAGIGDMAANAAGHLIMAFDPDLLGGRDALKSNVARLVTRVKGAKRLPGVDEILVPGERGDRATRRALAADEVEIEDNLYRELLAASREAPR